MMNDEQRYGIDQNDIARCCRVALHALGKPLVDPAIYAFAAAWNGGRALEKAVVEWAEEQPTRVYQDPAPGCSHTWRELGVTTVCDHPVGHSVCFECRTFRHGRASDTWFTKSWDGPGHWENEAKRHGATL